jgi:PAS domain S-box-containing protein
MNRGDGVDLPFESLGRGHAVRGASALALDPLVLQTLLDHIPMRATAVGRDHHYLYANRSFLESMGLASGQVIGRHVREVLGEALYQAYLGVADRMFGSGEALRWSGWMDYRGRGPRYYEQTLLPFVRDDGEVAAIITFGRDVTELKQRETELSAKVHELESTQALKAAIVDHSVAALISTDAEGRIVEFNPAAEAMFGHDRVHAVGRMVGELIIPRRYRAAHEDGMRRMATGGAPRAMGRRLELAALHADGSEFPVEMVLWRTEAAGTVYYTASLYDLSARQQAAREIERQREALRQSEKLTAMGSLLAGVAHELNNPLAIVMGRATLLEGKCEDPSLRADAARIREAAERCGRIVRTFLAMARHKPGARAPVRINDMVRGAADLLQYNLRTGGVTLELRLAEGLPEVSADPDQLGQVVLNLLVNAQQALAASASGDRLVRIETGVAPPSPGGGPQQVWLRVADNGPGVGAEHQARIFDPFYTTKPEGAGTGLGLAVSRSVAREHGGELALEQRSPFGAGASFRLSIPVADAVAFAPEPPPMLNSGHSQGGSAPRVLVVDDEAELGEVIRELLEARHLEVGTAESGAVALELLRVARFDAVVCDLRMPALDGPGLWRAVREQHPALARRFVFVTGDTLSAGTRQFLAETGCDCIEKPFAPQDLVSRVLACLEATPRT